jgi:FkbM family methyltransferase
MGAADLLSSLASRKPIDLVIDVGAHQGQTGAALRATGYTGRLVSFEPFPDAYNQLATQAAHDPAWHIRQQALGAEDGTATLHVTRNSASSSILRPTAWARDAIRALGHESERVVALARLDSIFHEVAADAGCVLLKIDSQGSERAILAGAEAVLPRIPFVVMEVSLVELYAGETLLAQMLDVMADYGYRLIDLSPAFRHRETGDLLQVDAAFARTDHDGLP